MTSQLESLASFTTIVADTGILSLACLYSQSSKFLFFPGDVDSIKEFKPTDATTNPSLIFAAAQIPRYSNLVDDAVAYGKKNGGTPEEKLSHTMDKLCVNFGVEIQKVVCLVILLLSFRSKKAFPSRLSREKFRRKSMHASVSTKKVFSLLVSFIPVSSRLVFASNCEEGP